MSRNSILTVCFMLLAGAVYAANKEQERIPELRFLCASA
jgi:hypothetical protein